MVSKSFKQFQFIRQKQKDRHLFGYSKQFLIDNEKQFDLNKTKKEAYESIYNIEKKRESIKNDIDSFYSDPRISLSFLTIGRIVFISGLGWCPIINYSRVSHEIVLEVFSILDNHNDPFIMKNLKSNSKENLKIMEIEPAESPKIISVDFNRLKMISSIVVIIPNDLTSSRSMNNLKETIFEMFNEFKEGIPKLILGQDIPIENDIK